MPTPDKNKTLYYPVWIAVGRRDDPISFGRPANAIADASREMKDRVRAGEASMGLVAKFADGKRVPIEASVYPESARKVVRHWLDIEDALEDADAET